MIIAVVAAGWVVASVALALCLGPAIRLRDTHRPAEPPLRLELPRPRRAPDAPVGPWDVSRLG